MRMSDWSSHVCSSDLPTCPRWSPGPWPASDGPVPSAPCEAGAQAALPSSHDGGTLAAMSTEDLERYEAEIELQLYKEYKDVAPMFSYVVETERRFYLANRSEEHTSKLQSLMRISYAGF